MADIHFIFFVRECLSKTKWFLTIENLISLNCYNEIQIVLPVINCSYIYPLFSLYSWSMVID